MASEDDGKRDRNWSIEFYCQWREMLRPKSFNWVNFDIIGCDFEYGAYKGRYFEFRVALLGFIVLFEWWDPLTRSAFVAEIDQVAAACRDDPEGHTVPFDFEGDS